MHFLTPAAGIILSEHIQVHLLHLCQDVICLLNICNGQRLVLQSKCATSICMLACCLPSCYVLGASLYDSNTAWAMVIQESDLAENQQNLP